MEFLCWIRLVYWKWTYETLWLAVGQLAHPSAISKLEPEAISKPLAVLL
jgi:hypothetical protein